MSLLSSWKLNAQFQTTKNSQNFFGQRPRKNRQRGEPIRELIFIIFLSKIESTTTTLNTTELSQ